MTPTPNTTTYATRSLEPGRALRAVVALMRNPDDTAQVFTIIESLSGTRHADRLRAPYCGPEVTVETVWVTATL